MLVAVHASATDAGEPVSIEYRAPTDCPDAREFVWRISARVPKTREAAPSEKRRAFSATIHLEPSGAEGRLVIREADGSESVRTLEAATCAEVADALALVVALAIDPRATTDVPRAPPPAPAPEAPPEPNPLPRTPWRFEAGLDGYVSSGFAPEVLLGAELFGGIRLESRELLSPVLRLGFGYVAGRSFAAPGGRASFGWAGSVVDLCPVGIHPGLSVSWLLCGRGELGVLSAHGSDTLNPRESNRFWLAAGPGTHLRLNILGPLAVEASGSLLFPWAKDRFLLGSAVIHEIPVAVVRGGLGLVLGL
jgi:hypothetical protein